MRIFRFALSMILSIALINSLSGESTSNLFNMSLEQLMDQDISTAGKKEEKVREIPASVVIITREEIENYGYRTVADILANTQGFISTGDMVAGPNFAVRGFWKIENNASTIIMINGVKQSFDLVPSNYLLGYIVPVQSISRIEVVRGPMSVQYGSGAFFGAINIITEPDFDDTKSTLTSGFSPNGQHSTVLSVFEQGNGFSYNINAATGHSFIDQPFSKILDSLRTPEGGNTTDMGSLKNISKTDNGHISFSAKAGNFELYMAYDYSGGNANAWVVPIKGEFSHAINRSFRSNISFNRQLNQDIGIRFDFGLFKFSRDWQFAMEPGDWGLQYIDQSKFSASLISFINLSSKLELSLGIDYIRLFDIKSFYDIPSWGLENMDHSTGNSPIETGAAYTVLKWKALDKLLFVGGLRLEKMMKYNLISWQKYGLPGATIHKGSYSNEDITFIPSLATIVTLNERNIIKLLYGNAIRHPSFFDVHDKLIWTQQKELDDEKIETFEINYLSTPLPDISVNLSLFYNDLEELIIRNQGFDADGVYYNYKSNAGGFTTKGLELQAQCNVMDNLQLDGAYTYHETEDKAYPGLIPAYSPHNLFYLKGVYSPINNLVIGMTGYYTGKMRAEFNHTPLDQSDPDSGPVGRIGSSTSAYFRADINLIYKNLYFEGLNLNIKVENILDKDYYYPATSYSIWSPKGIIGSPRTFWLDLQWRF